jgi:hypothetical protein
MDLGTQCLLAGYGGGPVRPLLSPTFEGICWPPAAVDRLRLFLPER